MARERKFSEIIERVEYVRTSLSMNKSRFSSGIGMKPQSYNNFIGAQGSKPNIELILGVVNTYHVNPYWLLNGTGEVFWKSSPDRKNPKSRPSPTGESSNSNKPLPRLRKKNKVTE